MEIRAFVPSVSIRIGVHSVSIKMKSAPVFTALTQTMAETLRFLTNKKGQLNLNIAHQRSYDWSILSTSRKRITSRNPTVSSPRGYLNKHARLALSLAKNKLSDLLIISSQLRR